MSEKPDQMTFTVTGADFLEAYQNGAVEMLKTLHDRVPEDDGRKRSVIVISYTIQEGDDDSQRISHQASGFGAFTEPELIIDILESVIEDLENPGTRIEQKKMSEKWPRRDN